MDEPPPAVDLDLVDLGLGAQEREDGRRLEGVAEGPEQPADPDQVSVGKKSLRSRLTTTGRPTWARALVTIDRPGDEAVRGVVDRDLLEDLGQDPLLGLLEPGHRGADLRAGRRSSWGP